MDLYAVVLGKFKIDERLIQIVSSVKFACIYLSLELVHLVEIMLGIVYLLEDFLLFPANKTLDVSGVVLGGE